MPHRGARLSESLFTFDKVRFSRTHGFAAAADFIQMGALHRRIGFAGETREERLARTGQSAIGDFQAIHWGWMMHRPLISPRERYFFLMGADSANKGYLALKDHTSWALVEGVTRAEIDEALIMLALYNGWPANRQSQVAVGEYFAERDATASSHPTPSP